MGRFPPVGGWFVVLFEQWSPFGIIHSDVMFSFPLISGWFTVLRTFNQTVLRGAQL